MCKILFVVWWWKFFWTEQILLCRRCAIHGVLVPSRTHGRRGEVKKSHTPTHTPPTHTHAILSTPPNTQHYSPWGFWWPLKFSTTKKKHTVLVVMLFVLCSEWCVCQLSFYFPNLPPCLLVWSWHLVSASLSSIFSFSFLSPICLIVSCFSISVLPLFFVVVVVQNTLFVKNMDHTFGDP